MMSYDIFYGDLYSLITFIFIFFQFSTPKQCTVSSNQWFFPS